MNISYTIILNNFKLFLNFMEFYSLKILMYIKNKKFIYLKSYLFKISKISFFFKNPFLLKLKLIIKEGVFSKLKKL